MASSRGHASMSASPLKRVQPRHFLRHKRLVIAGTPESVADQILAFRNEVGAFGTLLYTGHDWTDPASARSNSARNRGLHGRGRTTTNKRRSSAQST